MRREQLILPPLTAFEVTIFRNEPLPYPAIIFLFSYKLKESIVFIYCKLLNILHLFRNKIQVHTLVNQSYQTINTYFNFE
jgi:hypothetical protein